LLPRLYDRDAHGEFEVVGEGGDAVGFAVVVGVGHHEDAITGVAAITFRREVRVAFDGPDAAAGVDVETGGRDDLRVLGEEFNFDPRVVRTRWRFLCPSVGCEKQCEC